jgi:hypothetical protein
VGRAVRAVLQSSTLAPATRDFSPETLRNGLFCAVMEEMEPTAHSRIVRSDPLPVRWHPPTQRLAEAGPGRISDCKPSD